MEISAHEGDTPWISIEHSTPDGQIVHRWRAHIAGQEGHLFEEEGAPRAFPATGDLLEILRNISEVEPRTSVMPSSVAVEISCLQQVAAVLPLWLDPIHDEKNVRELSDDELYDLEDRLNGVSVNMDHSLTVNGDRWLIIESEDYFATDPPKRLFAVPDAGHYWRDLLSEVWAGYWWTETASMTSGLDFSMVGKLTPAVAILADKLDMENARIALVPVSNKIEVVRRWRRDGWLNEQLRSTWPPPGDEGDFIDWGLLQVAKANQSEPVQIRGADSPNDDYQGMGLGYSSEWSFFGSLTSRQWAMVLEGVSDRRPGTIQNS